MAAQKPKPRIVDAEDVKRSWPQALSTVSDGGERIVVEEDGVAVAAIVSLRDLEQLARFDADREEFFSAIERIGAVFADEDPDESDRLSALALAEARAEMRRERAAKSDA